MTEILRQTGQVHVGRQPAQVYRQELARLAGVDLDEWSALRALEQVVIEARPLARDLWPEAWLAEDEHALAVIARVIRWERQAAVVAVRVSDGASLLGAEWARAAVRQLSGRADLAGRGTRGTLDVVAAYAAPVDVAVQPEQWRSRLGPEQLDVSLAVQRVDREDTPLIVAAESRPLRSRGRSGRGRGSKGRR